MLGHFSHTSNFAYSMRKLKKAHHSKCHKGKMELPFIVRQLIPGFIIQCKALQGKKKYKNKSEWTHLQTCHWLSKCQIHPTKPLMSGWMARCRQSEFASPVSHKKVRCPMRDRVCQTDHRAAALSREKLGSKKFVTKCLWYFVMWDQPDTVQKAARYHRGFQILESPAWLHMPSLPCVQCFFPFIF